MILGRKFVWFHSALTKFSSLLKLTHSHQESHCLLRHISRAFNNDTERLNMPSQQVNKRSMITISVDGNISSGKSTLVSNLKELFPNNFDLQVELVPEPLEKWTNLRGHNLLGMFYDDRTKNNFMFQHYVQLTRLMEVIKKPTDLTGVDVNQKGVVRILERSLQNNRYCFTELARREGKLKPEEFAVLSEWHKWLEQQFDLTLDAIVYLRTDPETVYNRMQSRGRSEESSVPIEYLKSLHETYENWLVRGQIGCTNNTTVKKLGGNENVPDGAGTTCHLKKQKVLVIDGNQGIEEVAQDCKSELKALMNELGYTDTDSGLSTTKSRKICTSSDLDVLA